MLWEPGPVLSFIRIIVYLYFIIEFVPGLKLLTHWLLGASRDTPPLLFLWLPRQPGSPLTFVLCSHQQGPPQRALCGNRAWPFLSPSSSPSTPWPSTQPHVFVPLEFSFCKALFLSRLTCSFPLPNTHLSSLFSLLVCTCETTCALSTLPVATRALLYSLPSWWRVPLSWSWICPWESCVGVRVPFVHVQVYLCTCPVCPHVPSSFCTLKLGSSSRAICTHPAHCHTLSPNSHLVGPSTSGSTSHSVSARTHPALLCALEHPWSTLKVLLYKVLPLVLYFSEGRKGEEMGTGLGSCLQWVVGENPDQRKAPLTLEAEDGPVWWEMVSFLHCGVLGEGSPQISINQ